MKKVTWLLALMATLVFAVAAPVAVADDDGGDGNVVEDAEITQGDVGDRSSQAAAISGGDTHISQNSGNNTVNRFGHGGDNGVDHDNGHGHGHGGDHDNDFGVGGGDVHGHGGGVGGVALARTGSDAWILALLGGVALAGGLGLLAAQRRGRLNA